MEWDARRQNKNHSKETTMRKNKEVQDFESMFKRWFQLVAYKDPQHYQDLDWDWEEEIEKFIKNPCKEYNYQLSVKQEDDEEMNACRERDLAEIEKNTGNKNPTSKEIDEYFTNCFGLKMKRMKK